MTKKKWMYLLWGLLILLSIVVGTVIYLIPHSIQVPIPFENGTRAELITVTSRLIPSDSAFGSVQDEATLEEILDLLDGVQYRRSILPIYRSRSGWEPEDEEIEIGLNPGANGIDRQIIVLSQKDQLYQRNWGKYQVICDGEELYWKIRALLPISEE